MGILPYPVFETSKGKIVFHFHLSLLCSWTPQRKHHLPTLPPQPGRHPRLRTRSMHTYDNCCYGRPFTDECNKAICIINGNCWRSYPQDLLACSVTDREGVTLSQGNLKHIKQICLCLTNYSLSVRTDSGGRFGSSRPVKTVIINHVRHCK
jgi:hypothetical protein